MDNQSKNNCFDKISDMLKAYYPIIYLSTFEYEKTKQQIRGLIKQMPISYEFFEWNIVDGLIKRDLSATTNESLPLYEDPEEFLRYVKEQSTNDKPQVFVIEDFHNHIEEPNIILRLRQLAEILRYKRKHLILISSVFKLPIELEKYINVVDLPLPDRSDLDKVLQSVVNNVHTTLNDDRRKKLIDAALGMTVMEADLAFCLAAVKDKLQNDSPRIVAQEKQQIIKKNGLLEFCNVSEDLNSVGGICFLKEWLQKRKLAYDFKAQLWKLPEPKGVLLLGVPGCGKSLTAKCISALWNMPLLKLDIGKVFQGIVGSSEENIRRAISTAEVVAPCVLWIDEIEKGLSGTRSSGITDGGTTSRIFSTILTWMQEKTKPVFVVATANDISSLPPELLRKGRFDEIFFVDLPNKDDRKSIFDIHLKKKGFDPQLLYTDKLAEVSIGFNGAEIEEVINEGMFTAYTENPDAPKLMIKHLLDAINNIVPLSSTMSEQIQALRAWAKKRAKMAGKENVEKLQGLENLLLTKTEKEFNRSFDL